MLTHGLRHFVPYCDLRVSTPAWDVKFMRRTKMLKLKTFSTRVYLAIGGTIGYAWSAECRLLEVFF